MSEDLIECWKAYEIGCSNLRALEYGHSIDCTIGWLEDELKANKTNKLENLESRIKGMIDWYSKDKDRAFNKGCIYSLEQVLKLMKE